MNQQQWETVIRLSSIPLRRLNAERLPSGSGTGCIIVYHGTHFLLSAAHVTNDMENWAIALRFDPSQGVLAYQLGAMSFLDRVDVTTGRREQVDLAYVQVPRDLGAQYQVIRPDRTIKQDLPRLKHEVNFDRGEFRTCTDA